MSKVVNIDFRDDWTDEIIAKGDHEIQTLEVDGQWYEWDLASETRRMFLEEILGPWLRAGRKIARPPGIKSVRARANGEIATASSAAPGRVLRPGIKEWAVKQGLMTDEQKAKGGRVSREITAAYDKMIEDKERAQQPWGKNMPV